MIENIFFRGKGAYLVGSAFRAGDGHSLPLAWRRVQTALRAGNILDIFPYRAEKRLP